MNDFIEVYENIVPQELCDAVIASYERVIEEGKIRTQAGSLQLPHGKLFREDYAAEFTEFDTGNSSDIFEALNQAVSQYQEKYAILNDVAYITMRLKIQKTPIGGGYHGWHCETMTGDSARRLIVWSIYLNDVEEGGETEFLYQSKRVKARKGNLVLFPASYTHTHRGNPPLSNEKYILTGWFYLQDKN